MIYRKAFPRVWSSFWNSNEVLYSSPPGSYHKAKSAPFLFHQGQELTSWIRRSPSAYMAGFAASPSSSCCWTSADSSMATSSWEGAGATASSVFFFGGMIGTLSGCSIWGVELRLLILWRRFWKGNFSGTAIKVCQPCNKAEITSEIPRHTRILC